MSLGTHLIHSLAYHPQRAWSFLLKSSMKKNRERLDIPGAVSSTYVNRETKIRGKEKRNVKMTQSKMGSELSSRGPDKS
jgi:hypothetical protein